MFSKQNKILRLIFLGTVFLFSAKGTNLTTGQRSVVGDSLRRSGETWCVRGSYDGMHDEASLMLNPPPLSLDLHPFFNYSYLFVDSHHINSFWVLIAPQPQGGLTCEA